MTSNSDNYLALVVNDIEQFIDDEQTEKDIERSTAVSNVLFEWRAYYRDDAPEYVDSFEDELAKEIMQEKLEYDFKKNPSGYKGGVNRRAAYTLTVTNSELEDAAKKEIKSKLAKRGEPVDE